jgi:DNA-binding transcriptional regulator YiaG/DNA-directed RNA polymerase subunit RPC12/RpoP
MREHFRNAEAKSTLIKCPNCGSDRVDTHRQPDTFVYGIGDAAVQLSAVVPFHECAECGFEFTDSEAEDARHEAICRHLGVMTPTEVAEVRQHYEMTRATFAERSRIGEASLARWETGQLIQNAANDDYLYLLSFQQNMDRLEWRRSCDRLSTDEPANRNPSPRFREIAQQSSTPQQRTFLRAKKATACT